MTMPQLPQLPDLFGKGDLLYPRQILDTIFLSLQKAVGSTLGPQAQAILVGSAQDELYQAILADLTDIIPIVGDIGNVARIHDASLKGGDFPRKRISGQLVDLIAGAFPVIGDLADALTPTNTLNWLEAHGIAPTDLPRVVEMLKSEMQKGAK